MENSNVKITLPKNTTYKIALSKSFVGQIYVDGEVHYGIIPIEVTNEGIVVDTLNIVVTAGTSAFNKIII